MGSAALKSQASRDEADIRALIKTIDKAHRDKDAAAIVAPYAQDAVVCDLAPPLSHRGMDLQVKHAWLDTWEGPIDRQRDFNITVNGDFAFCHGLYRLGGTPKAAGRPISFWMRATVCMTYSNIDFINRTIFVVRGKTKNAKRTLSMSKEVFDLLTIGCFPVPRKLAHTLGPCAKRMTVSATKSVCGAPLTYTTCVTPLPPAPFCPGRT
jgi:ketosteroid isomerase-like protein